MHSVLIAIVTHNRRGNVLGLLESLDTHNCQYPVAIFENGSHVISSDDLRNFSLQIEYFSLPFKSIPRSRNVAIEYSIKKKLGWVIFIDDDCRITDCWLNRIKQLDKVPEDIIAWQGSQQSISLTPCFSIFEDISHQNWMRSNLIDTHRLRTTDTKNVALRLSEVKRNTIFFDINLSRAEDHEFGQRLSSFGKILFDEKWIIEHQAPNNWIKFLFHKFRLSYAYRLLLHRQKISFPKKHDLLKNGLNVLSHRNLSIIDKIAFFISSIVVHTLSRLALLVHILSKGKLFR